MPIDGKQLRNASVPAAKLSFTPVEDSGLAWREPVAVIGLIGNASVATVNGLGSPSQGDAYVMTSAGTLTAGTLAVAIGDLVEYSGTAWVKVVANTGGFVTGGTRAILSTSESLISPYTDVTDDAKIVEFSGSSNTASDTSERVDGNAVIVNGDGGVFENRGYVYSSSSGQWAAFGAGEVTAGNGISKTGNVISVDPDSESAGDIQPVSVTSDGVGLDVSSIAGTGLEADGSANLRIDEDGATVNITGGTWTYTPDTLQVSGTPNSGNDAVNKTYVDSLAAGVGVQWREPVNVINLIGNLTVAGIDALGTGAEIGACYITTDSGTPSQGSSDTVTPGDLISWNGTDWQLVVNTATGFPPAGTRAVLSTSTALVSPYTDGVDDGKIVEFSGSSLTGSDTGEDTAGSVVSVISDGDPIGYEHLYINAVGGSSGWVKTTGLGKVSATGGIQKGTGLTDDQLSLDLLSGGGLKLTGTEVGVEPNDFAGNGLEDDGADNLRIDPASTVTFSGATWTFPADELQVTGTPNTGNDAVNKTYVDNQVASAGLFVAPVETVYLTGNLSIAGINALGTGAGLGDVYVATDAGTPTQGSSDALVAGSMAEWNGTEWVEIVAGSGGFVPAGTRAALNTNTALISPYTDATDDGKIVSFSGSSNTGTDTGVSAEGTTVVTLATTGSVYQGSQFTWIGGDIPTGYWSVLYASLEWDKSQGVRSDQDGLSFDAAEARQAGSGLKVGSQPYYLTVEPDDFAGTGLVDDGADNLAIDEATGSVTFTGGTWTFPVDVLQVTGTPNSTNDAVNKSYVDSLAAGVGVQWREPVVVPNLIGNLTIAGLNGLSPTAGDAYVATDSGTPTAGTSDSLSAGDLTEFDGTSWKSIISNDGGFVPSGIRAIISSSPSSPYVGAGGTIVEFSGSSNTGSNTSENTTGSVAMVTGVLSINGKKQYFYFNEDWTQINGLGIVTATDGVQKSGDTLSLDLLSGGGLKLTGVEVGVEPNDFAGNGLEDDGADNLRIDPASSVTFSGATWTFPSDELQVTGTPSGANDAANKSYVDSAVSGLQWKNPVLGNLLGNVQVSELLGSEDVATINGLSPATDDAYVMEDSGTLTAGSLSVSTGDIVQYNGSAWVIAVANSGGFPPAAAYGLMKDTGTLVGTGFSGYTNGDLVDFDGSTLYGSSSSPTAGYSYVVGDNTTVTGTASTKEGDFLEWSGTAWVALVSGSGGFVPAGERAITGFEPPFVLISPYVDATDDGEIVEFSGSSNTGADTGDSSDGSSVLVQDPAHVGVYDNLAYVFEGTTPTGSWIQWSGAGQINAGLGLTKSGNTINVGDAGKGVQVNADDLEFSAAEAVAASGGLKAGSNSWQLAVEPNDFAGTGLVDDGADNLAIDEATGSVTFTGGTWTYPVDVLQVTGTPNSGNDAVNKTYVDGQISTSGVFRSEVSTIQLVGNLTVSGINALGTGSEIGDAYVVTDAGTPTQGSSDTMAAGDIAEWNGTSWFKIEANSGGFVPSGVRAAITTNTPASPYTSSQDEGKIVEFSGSSNTGTNTGETTDAIVLMVKPISGESIYDKTLFHFDGTVPTGFWLPIYPNRSWIGDGLDHTGDSFEVLPDTTSGGSSGIAPVTVGANGVGLTVSNIAGTGLRREPGEYNLEVDPASTVTFSGATWTFPVDDLQVTGTPNTGNDAVNKTYVDSVVASSGFMLEPVRTTELVGNLTIAGINALGTSANEGDAYVTTDAGTPTQGTSDSMVAGSIAEWDGTSWIEIAEGSGGFVPSGVRVALTSGTLISPYTDSTDNGKIAEFSGSSNTGTLTSEAATGRSVVVQGDGSLPGVPYFNNVMATFEGSVPTGFWHITHPSRLWVDDGITIDGAQIGVLADTTTGGNYEPVQVGADGVSILISNIAGTGLEADGSANLRLASPGDGLTGGAGSPIAVLGLNSSIDVTASGVEAAVPSTANKNMTASATSSDGDQATVTTVAAAFANGSYPVMLVNGIQEPVSSGDKTGVFYFSGDGGTNARTFAAVQAGDTIHFNGSIATYELTASDRLDILFNDAV